MRTRLHETRPPRRGRWESAPTVHPWRRVAIAVGIVFAVMLSMSVCVKTDAEAGTRYICRTSTRWNRQYYAVSGVTIGRATWIATGCFYNDHHGVKSLSLTVREDYTNAPWQYKGITSRWFEGGIGTHMLVKGARVHYEFCVPIAGCTDGGSPGEQVSFDAFGNFGWRVP